jgi:hypothetical protein
VYGTGTNLVLPGGLLVLRGVQLGNLKPLLCQLGGGLLVLCGRRTEKGTSEGTEAGMRETSVSEDVPSPTATISTHARATVCLERTHKQVALCMSSMFIGAHTRQSVASHQVN